MIVVCWVSQNKNLQEFTFLKGVNALSYAYLDLCKSLSQNKFKGKSQNESSDLSQDRITFKRLRYVRDKMIAILHATIGNAVIWLNASL